MSKSDKAKKRRAKKRQFEQAAGVALEVKPKPKPQRDQTGRFNRDPDPPKTALEARGRKFSGDTSHEARKALSAPHMCCELGFIMETQIEGASELDRKFQINRLWRIWCAYVGAYSRYRQAKGYPAVHPAGASIVTAPEPMQTEGYEPDLRDFDERLRDATNAYMRWEGHMGYIDNRAQSLLVALRDGRESALWIDMKPTPCGLKTLAALQALADVAEGRAHEQFGKGIG